MEGNHPAAFIFDSIGLLGLVAAFAGLRTQRAVLLQGNDEETRKTNIVESLFIKNSAAWQLDVGPFRMAATRSL